MAITDWPASERPREKLLESGPGALSDAELLAIFLRTGVKGKSAVDLARELLTDFGGLRPLLTASQADFCQPSSRNCRRCWKWHADTWLRECNVAMP